MDRFASTLGRSGRGLLACVCTIVACVGLAATASAEEIEVVTLADEGEGSLRAALATANSDDDGDRIVFEGELEGTVQLQSALPDVTAPLEIAGPGANRLRIRRAAGDAYRVLQSYSDVTLELSGLRLSGGETLGAGGGILAGGPLILDGVAITDNTAGTWGGGVFVTDGAKITDSEISANTANGSNTAGGLDLLGGALELTNSTIAGNSAPIGFSTAGGLMIYTNGLTVEVRNSTIAGNLGTGARDVLVLGDEPETTIGATIVGDGPAEQVACGGGIASAGFNLTSDTDCIAAPAETDLIGVDPLLAGLGAGTGEPTATLAPKPGSPALDAGLTFGGLTADQRGSERTLDLALVANAGDGDGTDIGAHEAGDRDGDGILDAGDDCPDAPGDEPSGCPEAERTLTLRFKAGARSFNGRLAAPSAEPCASAQKVRIHRVATGPDPALKTLTTSPTGAFKLAMKRVRRGSYYAAVDATIVPAAALCVAARSKPLRIR